MSTPLDEFNHIERRIVDIIVQYLRTALAPSHAGGVKAVMDYIETRSCSTHDAIQILSDIEDWMQAAKDDAERALLSCNSSITNRRTIIRLTRDDIAATPWWHLRLRRVLTHQLRYTERTLKDLEERYVILNNTANEHAFVLTCAGDLRQILNP